MALNEKIKLPEKGLDLRSPEVNLAFGIIKNLRLKKPLSGFEANILFAFLFKSMARFADLDVEKSVGASITILKHNNLIKQP